MDEIEIGRGLVVLLVVFALIILFVVIPLSIIDEIWIRPRASDKANVICQEQGYDFFESYSREGIMSETPIAIRCKYAEQSRKIDLNVNGGKE